MNLTEVGRVAGSVIDEVERAVVGSATRSSCCCSGCSPTGTFCSRTTPVSQRH